MTILCDITGHKFNRMNAGFWTCTECGHKHYGFIPNKRRRHSCFKAMDYFKTPLPTISQTAIASVIGCKK